MLSQQSFEVTPPASFSLKGEHQEHSSVFLYSWDSFSETRRKNNELFKIKTTSGKLRNTDNGIKKLSKILSLPPVFVRGGSSPSGSLSDRQLSDFLNFDKLRTVPWLPMSTVPSLPPSPLYSPSSAASWPQPLLQGPFSPASSSVMMLRCSWGRSNLPLFQRADVEDSSQEELTISLREPHRLCIQTGLHLINYKLNRYNTMWSL